MSIESYRRRQDRGLGIGSDPSAVGRRSRIRFLGGTVAALALIVPASAFSEGEQAFNPNVPLPTEADYQALFERQAPDEATIVEQTTATERDESESAFAGASDAAALDLVREEFSDIVRAELFPEVDVPAGDEISYVGKYSAVIGENVVSQGGPLGGVVPLSPDEVGQNALVQSTVPLQAPEGGALEPLDADLEQVGDHFEPGNAVVNTEIPVVLEQGIELESAEVAVTPASTEGAQAVAVSDKLFYPNTDSDTDTLVAPLPNGVEIFFQLRSAESPEAHAIDLDLPEGAALVSAAEGGAQVIKDGEVLIDIPPASAWDAAGTQVEVSYELSGDRLTVAVPHRDREDLLYPILVDPIVDNYPWNPGPQETRSLDFWNTHTSFPGGFHSFFHEGTVGVNGSAGVMTRAVGGKFYGAGTFGQWQVWPIRASYIEAMGYHNFDHDRTEPATCTLLAIWDPQTQSFAWGNWYDAPSNTTGWGQGTYLCSDAAHQTKAVWVGGNADPDGEGVGDPEAPDGSMGLFVLRSEQGGNRSVSSENLLRSANVHRGDRNYPSITSAPTSGWSKAPAVQVHDPGLGVSGLGVFESNGGGQNWVSGGGSAYCSGAHQAVCPEWTTLNLVDLPEGRRTLYAQAFDAVWNGSFPWQWTARIDRSPPTVQTPSGTFFNQRENILPDQTYSLMLSADDGSTASPSLERSGVKRLDVYVDGESAPRFTAERNPCSEAGGGCPMHMDSTWTVPVNALEPGDHTIRVSATDRLGHTDPDAQVFTIEVEDIPHAQAFRATMGYPSGFAYVRGLFLDPTTTEAQNLYGVPLTPAELEDLDRRIEVQEALQRIDEYAAANAPNSYAGVYMDQDAGGLVRVGFTNSVSQHVQTLRETFPYPDLLRGVAAARSQSTLDGLRDQISADRSALLLDGISIEGIYTDVEANRVEVVTATSPGTARAGTDPPADPSAVIESRYGAGVAATNGALADQNNEREQPHWDNQKSGYLIRGADRYCTSGFGARGIGSNDMHFVLTAGHCYPNGTDVSQGGITLGKVVARQTSLDADVELIKVPAVRMPTKVYVRPGHTLDVTRAQNAGADHQWDVVCASLGRSNRRVCGVIASTNFQQGPYRNLRLMNILDARPSKDGDSGSPIYVARKHSPGARALGILKAKLEGPGRCSGCLVYSHIAKIEGLMTVNSVGH